MTTATPDWEESLGEILLVDSLFYLSLLQIFSKHMEACISSMVIWQNSISNCEFMFYEK